MPPACDTLLAPLNTVLATRTHASCRDRLRTASAQNMDLYKGTAVHLLHTCDAVDICKYCS